MRKLIIILMLYLSGITGKKLFSDPKQEWGYVKVREYAHMFWWLYFTTADVEQNYNLKPLIIWLQGGPGQSSTGYGNFMEIGPLDMNLKFRNHTWVNHYNILFVDNPVGSGFSYVEHPDYYSKTNVQIATDLMSFMKAFYQMFPRFAKTSIFIVSESYGGKMAVEFANIWYKEQSDNRIESNLKGVILGSPWISPIASVMEYAQLLLYVGMIDTSSYDAVKNASLLIKSAIEEENWRQATALLSYTELLISKETHGLDIFNFASIVRSYQEDNNLNANVLHYDYLSDIDKLAYFMNTKVRAELDLYTYWGSTAAVVFRHLEEDFMKPVTDQVEMLLNNTDLNVYIYNGQLDIAVNVVGTMKWMEELQWDNSENWRRTKRKPLVIDGLVEGYLKELNRLKMFWINRAGHMAVAENPIAVLAVLEDMVKNS